MSITRQIAYAIGQSLTRYGKGSRPSAQNRAWADENLDPRLAAMISEFQGTAQQRAMAAESSIWVWACLDFRATRVAKTPWHIKDKNGRSIEEHPFLNAYAYAFIQFQQDILYDWMLMKLAHGEVYIEKLKMRSSSMPGGLLVLNSMNFEPEIINGEKYYYRYTVGSMEYHFQLDELFFDKIRSLSSDLRGKSPMDRALEPINIDRFNASFIKSYFKNDGKSGGVFTLRQGASVPTPEEEKQILKQWQEQGNGAENGFKTRILNGPFEFYSYNNKPPESGVLSEDQRRLICTEFDVPMALVNASSVSDPLGANTTLRELKAHFAEHVLDGDLSAIEKYINLVILPWLAPGIDGEFEFDRSEIESLVHQTKDNVDMWRSDLMNGTLTINQYREKRGEELLPGGDVLMIPQNVKLIPLEKLGELAMVNADRIINMPLLPENQGDARHPDEQHKQLPAGKPEQAADNQHMMDDAKDEAKQKALTMVTEANVAYVSIPVSDNPILAGLHKELSQLHPAIQWQDPTTYHVTLCYCLDVSDQDLEQIIADIRPQKVAFTIVAYGVFDTPDGFALHLRIATNDELSAMQSAIYNLFTAKNLPMSAFSLPSAWNPHITLGYIKSPEDFYPKTYHLSIEASEVAITRDNYRELALVKAKTIEEELSQWYKIAMKNPAKATKFECHIVPKRLAFQIRMELERNLKDKETIKAMFETVTDIIQQDEPAENLFSLKMAHIDAEVIAQVMANFEEIGAQDMIEQFNQVSNGAVDELT